LKKKGGIEMMKTVSAFRGLCTNCEKEAEFERVIKKEIFTVRGEPITVNVEYTKCKECGDVVLNPAINHDPFELAYREYRQKHALLQPEEISSWRKAHHLTQGEFAKLLGIGVATLNRYENGALQNESYEKLLRLAMDSSNLLRLIEKSEGIFTEARKKKLLETLRESEEVSSSLDNTIMINFGGTEKDSLNGFRKLDLSKLYNAVLFFSKDGVLKSKLNKLLFYADFKHFKEYTLSITGLRYAHLPYGPVPDNYAMYYATMFSKGLVEFMEEPYPNGYVGELIKAVKEPDLNVFSPSELRIMAAVMEDFKGYTATQIQELSHKERGYQQTIDGEIISYTYANELNY
jgi:putative zinc finger/helix-turn-helix YgiT family protein